MLQNKWPIIPCSQPNTISTWTTTHILTDIYIYYIYIYIYIDHEHELDYCMKLFTGLDASLLQELQQMIKNVNPYVHKYLHVAETIAENPAVDIKLVLRLPGK